MYHVCIFFLFLMDVRDYLILMFLLLFTITHNIVIYGRGVKFHKVEQKGSFFDTSYMD